MTPLIEKYLDIKRIEKNAIEKNYDKIAFDECIQFMNRTLEKEECYISEQEDYVDVFFLYVDDYMEFFEAERKKGFSVEWSRDCAQQLLEETKNSIAYAYIASKKVNPKNALADLNLYAKLTNRDEFFVKHLAFLTTIEVPNTTPSFEKQAIIYSRVYKEEIEDKKSEFFANHYAYSKALKKYTEMYCYTRAMEYEKAILAGYSERSAYNFSCYISDYIVDNFSSYEEAMEDIFLQEKRKEFEEFIK